MGPEPSKPGRKPYDDSIQITGKQLGEGSYGTVMEGLKGRKLCAIKIAKKGNMNTEVAILKYLESHENIASIIESEANTIVMQKGGVDLNNYLEKYYPLKPRIIQKIMCGILNGLAFIHCKQVVHRDINPNNILIRSKPFLVKIIDFGFAILTKPPHKFNYGNTYYAAPELVLRCKHYGNPVDMWAAGLIFLELFTYKSIFGDVKDFSIISIKQIFGPPNEDAITELSKMKNIPIAESDKILLREKPSSYTDLPALIPPSYQNISPIVFDLLKRMLDWNPATRITAKEALQHDFLKVSLIKGAASSRIPKRKKMEEMSEDKLFTMPNSKQLSNPDNRFNRPNSKGKREMKCQEKGIEKATRLQCKYAK
jgi:serine/threonine protein kinase